MTEKCLKEIEETYKMSFINYNSYRRTALKNNQTILSKTSVGENS